MLGDRRPRRNMRHSSRLRFVDEPRTFGSKRVAVSCIGIALFVCMAWGGWSFLATAPTSAVPSTPQAQATPDTSAPSPTASLPSTATQAATPQPAAQPQLQTAEASTPVVEPQGPVAVCGVITPGDTVSSILGEFFGPADIHALAQSTKPVFPINRICVGSPYTIVSTEHVFERFEYQIDADRKLIVTRNEAGEFIAREQAVEYERRQARVRSTINTSLFGAVADAGEKPALALHLADIFGWDVDFVRDIRTGDDFTVVVEKKYLDGEFKGYGRVLAAAFTNQGDRFTAFGFEDANGHFHYYDETGRSMRKAFLKAPLNFSRISSGFTWRRLHPIKKVYRAHPAIDYAAPMGTPVEAVGDGVVTYAGYDRAAGYMVKLRHGAGYETYYLHLKGFARGIKKGVRVKQGKTIGFVGSTGLSTGPHLDYRMKQNGKYINPTKVKSPPAASVPKARMQEYEAVKQSLAPLLEAGSELHAALPDTPA